MRTILKFKRLRIKFKRCGPCCLCDGQQLVPIWVEYTYYTCMKHKEAPFQNWPFLSHKMSTDSDNNFVLIFSNSYHIVSIIYFGYYFCRRNKIVSYVFDHFCQHRCVFFLLRFSPKNKFMSNLLLKESFCLFACF